MKIADKLTGIHSIALASNKVITITKRTIHFSQNVCLSHNIESFSEGEVDIATIPFWIIVILFMVGAIISSYNVTLGLLLTLSAFFGFLWNFMKPKHYGLLLTFSSGNKILFTTIDRRGIKNVISVIYEFFETETEKKLMIQISITNSHVSVNNIYDSYVGGNVFGDVIESVQRDDK
ncbi:hypothetical protein QUA56_12665 [Microcoleus sp. N3A4]|uniref:hypothetical protein n=1 Tax=Microcoleus sp. N3A4 TaxID=3055379 RepID=UPI002FD378B9